MPFLLLLLLAAIGLVITLVGYLLTPKTQLQSRNRRTAYRTDYDANRSGRRVREPVTTRNVRYVAAYTEESTWTWADVWQSLSISRVFRRRLGEPAPWLGLTLILVSVFLLGMITVTGTPEPAGSRPIQLDPGIQPVGLLCLLSRSHDRGHQRLRASLPRDRYLEG